MKKTLLCAAALLAAGAATAAGPGAARTVTPTVAGLPPAAQAAMTSISGERIAGDVKFLASDLLEGRGTGSRGAEIAAEYLATEFAKYGLQPLGDQGSYLQQVRVTGITTKPDSTTASLITPKGGLIAMKYADDYVVSDKTAQASEDIDAPIVYVGFGIEAPEYGWDDFKGVDVKGKMLLLFVNEPESTDVKRFNGPALTYYGRWTYKFEQAARKGAVGALIIHRTDLASYPWDVVRSSWTGEEVELADDRAPKVKAASWITLDIARKLFADSGLDLDTMYQAANQRDFKPVELKARYNAHIDSSVRSFQSSNVLGLLPGKDSGAPRQVVAYTAHYDHLGIVPGKGADTIYNGAVDNATGCAVLLEMLRAYVATGQKPPHPILFAAVTAEEKGLLGSRYLGQHLPVPAQDITLDLNYDAILPVGEPESVNLTGAERSDFYPVVERVAKTFGMGIVPDAKPGAGHYYRSDHFSMARVGVPAFSINEGTTFVGHPPEWGLKQEENYTEHDYHQPSDEYRPDMDWRGNAKLARFGFALGWLASSQKNSIGWKAGDEFDAIRRGAAAR